MKLSTLAAAASLATVATNPVDVVKTRLQALPGGAGGCAAPLAACSALLLHSRTH